MAQPAATSQPLAATMAATNPAESDEECTVGVCRRDGLMERERLLSPHLPFLGQWADCGFEVLLSSTQIYQQNLRGGLSTHRHAGRYSGIYDLEMALDLEKVKLVPGGRMYMLAEGGWSEGIDEPSVGSLFGVNFNAIGDRAMDVAQLWYEQSLAEDRVRIRAGKIDLTGTFECQGCPVSFDGNTYANDATLQFLNGALSNNPTIPFPDPGLGAIVYVEPVDGFYLSGGVADADADFRETGFNTAFQGEDNYIAIFETGIIPRLPSPNGPMIGAYRVGFWYDPQAKERFDGGTKRDDTGFYLSFDQMAYRECSDEDDTQGLGLFARYGLTDGDVNEIRQFWSLGAQYQGLLPGRDSDVLGAGLASGCLSPQAGFGESNETVMEVYYNIMITPWLSLTPDLQYVANPGGEGRDAVIGGVRLQVSF